MIIILNFQDYPSISQLASKIAHNRMNVIFAVTEKQVDRYMALSDIIPGSVAGQLANDSSNIVQLVRENYEVRKQLHLALYVLLSISETSFNK